MISAGSPQSFLCCFPQITTFLWLLSFFFFCLRFSVVWLWCFWEWICFEFTFFGIYWASWVCKYMSSSRFWMFGVSISSNMCSILSPLLLGLCVGHISVLHSFFLPISMSLYGHTTFSFSNHLLMDIRNNAAMNIPVQVFVWVWWFYFSWVDT